MNNPKINKSWQPALTRLLLILAAAAVAFAFAGISDAAVKQRTFASPEAAVKALIEAGKKHDMNELLAIFGPGGKEILFSGDEVADKQGREAFLNAYEEKHSIIREKGGMVLLIGKDDWPFPVPIVKKGNSWRFDSQKGKEEILDRRIGRNELNTIQTCLAVVDAEREYAQDEVSAVGVPLYAQKLMSDPGKHDGLYWETKEGEKPSPMGPLVAQAMEKGYKARKPGEKPMPYFGYYYRLLKGQGKHAPDGAYDYIVNGQMIGGFALVAYPAKYGNSGVMTFIVNQDGVVYQKDLGKDTEKAALAITKYDPDKTWEKVK